MQENFIRRIGRESNIQNGMGAKVLVGLEVILDDAARYRGRSAALLCNQTSVERNLEYGWKLLGSAGVRLKRIFSPEHGLFAVEQDQKPVSEREIDSIEIISLYGADASTLFPSPAVLDDIDVIFIDIQDIGARYYTYLNTMAYLLRAVQGRDIECVVLDRPNPLCGIQSEGPGLGKEFQSFVGVFDVPVRHGLTCGEIALMYHKKEQIDCELTIVPMKNWKRELYYDGTGLPWIPPSPNMPTLETALVYPGICLIEGTNLSEGRGTTTPFQVVGAPFIQKADFAKRLNSMNMSGVYFRPIDFKPTFNKCVGEICGGVFIHVLQRANFRPFLTGVAVIQAAMELYGDCFQFTSGMYEFNDVHPAFDLLCGTNKIREALVKGQSIEKIQELWLDDEWRWDITREQWWVY